MITNDTEPRNDSVFVRTLKEEMTRLDVNQADIAYALKISQQFVSDVMRGRRYPFYPHQLTQLAQQYGFDMKKLLLARAWSVKRLDIPQFATYEQVEEAFQLLNHEKERSYA
jgi:predicted XRE-type DNA-binding protein